MKSYSSFQPYLSLIFILLFIPSLAFTQGEKLKSVFIEAESYFLFEEYKDALPLYQKLLASDPDNFNLNFKIGICYLNDIYQVKKSITYLEKAAKGISSASKTTSFKERMAPPEALYYLGNAYSANNRLNDAIKQYEEFKLVLDPLIYDVSLVDEKIKSCKVAADQQTKPMYFISSNLGEGVNDRFEETNAVVSGDERILVFNRKLQFYDAVFFSKKENGKWSEPVNLTPAFGVDGNSYCTGISYNGDELLVYRSDNFDGNLYVSKFKGGKWNKLEKLNGNINTKYWESHASFSKDGKTLYFCSNRDGGYGGLDIYRSERTRGGDWGPAINLGPVINSRFNEDTPFITEDGSTLYYSSMGHYNMGGYDIFYSTRLDNGQWAKPINVGFPLNTTNDDLFFVPVRDGAYAYYSKYNPQDTYGMLDIYKLEVFTELHPRKFILNGISRVDGKVNPSYTQYTARLVNPKTGKIIDQTKLNPDGTYTLNALSGDFNLEISGRGINDLSERLSVPVDNPSNIITHSSILTSAGAESTAVGQVQPIIQSRSTVGPEMIIPVESYNVTTNEAIPIRLDLERNTKLKVLTFLNDNLIRNEQFDIKRRRFVYMLTPLPGTNLLHFTLVNEQGDSTVREVVVTYTPEESETATIPPVKKMVLAESDRYKGLCDMSQGKLNDYLKSLDLSKFESIASLYEHLISNAEKQGYTAADVDELMKRFLSQKDLNLFYDEMVSHSSDSLKNSLNNTDLAANRIFTSEALLDYLYQNPKKYSYSIEDLRQALYAIASLNRDPSELISLLESYSTGDLKNYLQEMGKNEEVFADSKAVADNIIAAAENKQFPLAELDYMLKLAAADINMHFLSQGLIFISSDNLKQCLLDLNLERDGIHNSMELISYLLDNAVSKNYSKRELLENIEKIRRDPYYYVDLFRKMLAERATGGLKEFLREIDIRDLKINTFENLIDYLLNQSQFHDYNREMVYQLLIDIIDPKNAEEFIALLKQYADEKIINALNNVSTDEFSKPLEVVQYLLSVADEYHYTEKDLLRALLKMLLRKGPSAGEMNDNEGWFSGINKPALITSLVVINAVIILLIIFIVRKKRKNE